MNQDNHHLNILSSFEDKPFFQKTTSFSIAHILLLITVLFFGFTAFHYNFPEEKEPLKFNISVANFPLNNDLSTSLNLDNESFTAIDNHYVNLGAKEQLWLKLAIKHSNFKTLNKNGLVLVLNKNRIHTPVELHYLSSDSQWKTQVIHSSPQFLHDIVSRLPTDMASPSFYLKLQGRYFRATLHIFDNDEFLNDIQQSTFFNGLFYGMLVLFALYHLLLFLKLKEPSYLAYSAMLFLLGCWFLSGQGWLEYFAPHIKFLHNKTVVIGILLVIAIAEFAKHYLQIKLLSSRLYKTLIVAQTLLGAFALIKLTFAQYLPDQLNQAGYTIGLILSFCIFIVCFGAAILAVKKQVQAAWYYLAATIMFFIVASMMGLSAGNIINFGFSWPLLQLTSSIEIVIFSAGLVSIYYQQRQAKLAVEDELKTTQLRLLKALEASNLLKDKVLNNIVDHKLFPELAKITHLLEDIIYVQTSGNCSLVVYKKNHRKATIELACNLQNIIDSFEQKHFLRVHKSYLINPRHPLVLQRRTSADYDINILNELVPIGRKHLSHVKALI